MKSRKKTNVYVDLDNRYDEATRTVDVIKSEHFTNTNKKDAIDYSNNGNVAKYEVIVTM